MKPGDLGKLMDEAFAKVNPVDEKHRAMLERLQTRFSEANQSMTQEVNKIKQEFEERFAPQEALEVKEETQRLRLEREQDAKEAIKAMSAAFDEQAELILRIAGARKVD